MDTFRYANQGIEPKCEWNKMLESALNYGTNSMKDSIESLHMGKKLDLLYGEKCNLTELSLPLMGQEETKD